MLAGCRVVRSQDLGGRHAWGSHVCCQLQRLVSLSSAAEAIVSALKNLTRAVFRLATDRADRKIERKLKLEACQAIEKRSSWLCTVTTSDVSYAGTDANVYIQVSVFLSCPSAEELTSAERSMGIGGKATQFSCTANPTASKKVCD